MSPFQAAARAVGVLVLLVLLASCGTPAAAPAHSYGISGMARIDASSYLIVRDLKSFENGARLGVLTLNAGRNYRITDVAVSDWAHADGPASDLEAACAIPGRTSEFLLLESGHWEGRYGRLFHVRLSVTEDAYSADVVHAYDMPEFDPKALDDPGDEMEGLACASRGDGSVLVILAERGGSPAYPNGLLRWLTLDTAANAETWTPAGRAGVEIDAPGEWRDPRMKRDISALHLHSDGSLWAAAAEDLSDRGPFNSVVYRLGSVLPDADTPIEPDTDPRPRYILRGFKVEALAPGTVSIPGSEFAIGTEDEVYGGAWRPLR